MHSEGADACTWDVTLPDKTSASFDLRRPAATLTLGDGRSFSVPVEVARTLENTGFGGGSFAFYDELLAAVERAMGEAAWKRVCALLNHRDYTAKELRDRLVQRGYSEESADRALALAEQKRILDDTRYARTFIETKLRRGWGRRRIEQELRQRGLELDTLIDWTEAAGDVSEEETALELARRKRVSGPNERAKLVRFLVGRGYSVRIATDAARQALAERQGIEE